MKITKTGKSKFGWYVMDEASSFTGCSEEVSNFLKSQVPCEIDIEKSEGEGKYMKILRAKVVGKTQNSNEMDEPVETVKPGEVKQANEYVDDRQNSIESQFSIREAIKMIEVNNACQDFDNIKPTKENIRTTALIVKEILKQLKGE